MFKSFVKIFFGISCLLTRNPGKETDLRDRLCGAGPLRIPLGIFRHFRFGCENASPRVENFITLTSRRPLPFGDGLSEVAFVFEAEARSKGSGGYVTKGYCDPNPQRGSCGERFPLMQTNPHRITSIRRPIGRRAKEYHNDTQASVKIVRRNTTKRKDPPVEREALMGGSFCMSARV